MKLLIVLPRFPYPIEKGDKLRAFHFIKRLSEKHEIILCAISDKQIPDEHLLQLKPYSAKVHVFYLSKATIALNLLKCLFTKLPFQSGYFFDKKIKQKIGQIIEAEHPAHIFTQLIRTTEYTRHVKDIPKTLDYMDSFSAGMKRRIAFAPFLLKPVFKMEYKRLKAYEVMVFNDFENKIIISAQDRDEINHPDSNKIGVIPNGVEIAYFQNSAETEKLYDLVFTGNMGYYPNVRAAEFLIDEIYPLLKQKIPGIKILIAGANPTADVKALARKNIHVTGWVNDIRLYYAAAKIFIAPMQTGSGLQNKLLEAMAMGLPCITSTLANNALKALSGKEILVAETAKEYADNVIALLTNEQKRQELGNNGLNFIKENYNWDNFTAKLETIFSGK